VEHCIGPLGVGTLIVKPIRHVEHVADLTAEESGALGPLLQATCSTVTRLCEPSQVYVCLWSHGPVHIHFVVQPVDDQTMERFSSHGPQLQAAMFRHGEPPDVDAVERFSTQARKMFAEPAR
jgi:diadenosine tetraphosphate (Ap4A) HIT family hydrolase